MWVTRRYEHIAMISFLILGLCLRSFCQSLCVLSYVSQWYASTVSWLIQGSESCITGSTLLFKSIDLVVLHLLQCLSLCLCLCLCLSLSLTIIRSFRQTTYQGDHKKQPVYCSSHQAALRACALDWDGSHD